MENIKAWELFDFALEAERWSRKPHRKAPEGKELARDLAKIVKLSEQRKAIALRFEEEKEESDDEAREAKIIGKLQAIGLKYGWNYKSADNGLSGAYVVGHASEYTEILIPSYEGE